MATLIDPGGTLKDKRGTPENQRMRWAAWYGAALVAAWIVPLAVNAVKLDWLLLIGIWVGTASLLEAGRILMDRLFIAAVVLAGYLVTMGMLYSVWPWGLDPVPIAGVAFSTLVVISAATGRRPRLPRKVVPTDSLILGSALLSWIYLYGPISGKSFIKSLPFTAAREDFFNHYTIYDAIHRIGGYPFIKQDATHPFMSPTAMEPKALRYYPSGMHFLDAILDIFLRSTTDPGSSIGEYHRFVVYSVLNSVLLAAAVVWAARWIGGPGLAGWRRGFVCSVVAGLAAVGQLSTLFWQGFNAQTAGLILVAVGIAVMVRPPRRVQEQVILIASVVISATFVYDLTALMILGTAGLSVLAYRRRLLRHWRFTLAVGIPAIAVALVPYVAPMLDGFSASNKFLAWGTSVRFSRTLSVTFVLLALCAVATRNGRRSPVWRLVSATVVFCAALTVGMGYYAYTKLGVTNYYYEKLVEGVWVVTLVSFGSVGMVLKPGPALLSADKRGQWITKIGVTGLAVATAAVMAGVIPLTSVRFPNWVPKQDVSWASVWKDGDISSGFSDPIAKAAKAGLVGDDKATIVLFSNSGHDNRSASMFVAALNHDRGLITDVGIDMIAGSDGLATMKLPKPGQKMADKNAASLANLENIVRQSTVPLRIVVWNRDVADYMKGFATDHPNYGLNVVWLKN